jgi:hypothetical protein
MKRKQIIQATAGAIFICLLAGGKVLAAGFTFTKIADTNQTFSSNSSLGLGLGTAGGWSWYDLAADPNYQKAKGLATNNNGGTVAYFAKLKNGTDGIFASTGVGAPKLIADNKATSLFSSFGQGISISKNGTVAFVAKRKDNGVTGIYTYDGNPNSQPKLIADNSSGSKISNFAPGLSINDKGEVAFSAQLKSGGQEIFKGNGLVTTNISNCVSLGTSANQCPLTGWGNNGVWGNQILNAFSPSINNDGMVAFTSINGVFTGDGNSINQILSNPVAFWNGSYREANINDSGLVSAFAHNNGQGQMLFAFDGSNGSIVAANNFDTSGSLDTFFHMGSTSINNKGIVAFMANQANVGKGIFIGEDAVKDKIIGVGSTLLDSTVVDLAMDRESLSNDNEISFWAKLANGIEGIFRANKFADSQYNPWLPNCPPASQGVMSFCNIPTGKWYDPPTAYGFNYKMTSESLFTSILDLPSNFIKPFTVAVGDILLGEFTAGDRIDFSQFAAKLGGLLVNGTGVKEFTVTGLDVDPSNPAVFPIKLASNTDLMSFDMQALLNPDTVGGGGGVGTGGTGTGGTGGTGDSSEPVPEPTTMLGTALFGAIAVKIKRQRAAAKKSAN